MALHNQLGEKGEQLAVDYLLQQGYVILDRNWRYQKAEIDIIARKNEVLAIVEVKTRTSIALGNPESFVSKKKIKLLVGAADTYINQTDLDVNVRFDIVSIHKEGGKFNIYHIKDAFLFF